MILHTTMTGEGEPLVLIHSGGMTGTTEYDEQSDYFAGENFRVIRPGLRGHGQSVGKVDNFFSECVGDIKETLDHLHMDKVNIAGVSLGGVAALLFARAYPQQVKSVCISGVFSYRPDNWEEMSKEESDHIEQLLNDVEAVHMLDEIHGDNDWKKSLQSFELDNDYPFDQIGDVADLDAPVLCMVGEQQELEISSALHFKQLSPAINIAVIPFAGHLVHRDQPEFYTQTLHTFIEHA